MTPSRWLLGFVTVWLAASSAAPEVRVLTVAREGRVFVSCSVEGGLAADMEQALQSGLTVSFTYDVELRRPVSVWFDQAVAVATVTASAQLDTLAGRYQISRSVDGRIEDSLVSPNKADVARFMTAFERLPLFLVSDLEPNVDYVVRIRVRARPRVTWAPWPFGRPDAVGFARLTFIP